jgi:hypothetical protein
MMIKKLLTLLFLFSGFQANASIIFNGYTHDTSTDIVTGGGLDWLQWDYTIGQSVDTALAGAATSAYGGGWALASNEQMAGLFNSFGFGAFVAHESTNFSFSDAVNVSEDVVTDNELAFVSMFGDTYAANNFSLCYLGECFQETYALYGSDVDGDFNFKLARVFDDYRTRDTASPSTGQASLDGDNYNGIEFTSHRAGVALVRLTSVPEPSVPEPSVPEPSIIALFGLGLVGIGFARRKRQS